MLVSYIVPGLSSVPSCPLRPDRGCNGQSDRRGYGDRAPIALAGATGAAVEGWHDGWTSPASTTPSNEVGRMGGGETAVVAVAVRAEAARVTPRAMRPKARAPRLASRTAQPRSKGRIPAPTSRVRAARGQGSASAQTPQPEVVA